MSELPTNFQLPPHFHSSPYPMFCIRNGRFVAVNNVFAENFPHLSTNSFPLIENVNLFLDNQWDKWITESNSKDTVTHKGELNLKGNKELGVLSLYRPNGKDYLIGIVFQVTFASKTRDDVFRDIVEHQTEFICRYTPELILSYANDAYLRYNQSTLDDALGKRFLYMIPEEDREYFLPILKQLSPEYPSATTEHRAVLQNGEVRWQRWTDKAIYDSNGVLIEYQSVGRDITDYIEAEFELAKSEALYRAVVEDQQEFICRFNPQGRIVFANNAFCRLTNKSPIQVMKLNFSDIFKQNDAIKIRNFIERESSYQLKMLVRMYNLGEKTWQWIKWTISTIQAGEGIEYQVVGIDTTEIEMSRRALIQARKLSENLRKSKELFFANISHEIRTPLTAIIGFTSLLQHTELSSIQQAQLKSIKLAADNLLVIINDLLDFSKMEAGKFTLNPDWVNVEDIIAVAINNVSYQADQKGLAINIHTDPILHTTQIRLDGTRLQQVLLNLLANAVKFTDQGHIDINTQLANNGIKSILTIKIVDTGIGIATKDLNNLFHEYSSISSETRGGTGLGLTIVQFLIKAHGGTIDVDSAVGKGSTFTITIPVDTKKLTPTTQHKYKLDTISIIGGQKRVLIVEDNILSQEVILHTLRLAGINADTAENGKVAIQKIENEVYDLILLDLELPDTTGQELIIKFKKLHPTTPVLAVTAHKFEAEVKEMLDLGFNEVIMKPFEMSIFLDKVQYFLTNEVNTQLPQQVTEPEAKDSEPVDETQKMLAQLLPVFLTQTEEVLEELTEPLAKRDEVAYARLIHKIKPSLLMYKLEEYYEDLRVRQGSLAKMSDAEVAGFQKAIRKDFRIAKKVLLSRFKS